MPLFSSTNKPDGHDITEILLNVKLNYNPKKNLTPSTQKIPSLLCYL